MAAKPKSYGDAMVQARQVLAQSRLNDPGEHFPYKHAEVTRLIDENPPMGPGVPGGIEGVDDRSREVADYMSAGIADATRDYVEAQAAYLEDPSQTNLDLYAAARDRLQAARLDHRRNRGQGFTV